MDPTTTLITFMLQASPSIQSVELLGSWDNFSQRYPMERDLRRGKDQWRGCHTFKDIICDGDGARGPARTGGLKMGQEYWYYYELNHGTEVHDPTLPSTTSCPYLPGQQVNSIWVPVEVSPLRERSASTSALTGEYKTMNPDDKFLSPRAPPAIPKQKLRLNTAPEILERKRSSRSVSPKGKSPWSTRLFGLMSPTSAQPEFGSRGRLFSPTEKEFPRSQPPPQFPIVSVDRPYSRRTVSRDASPQSQRKLQSQSQSRDHSPLRPNVPDSIHSTNLTIPDEIAEEEFEDDVDDANFASTLEASETFLSPPPQRQIASLRTAISDMKPLPMIPTEASSALSPLDTLQSLQVILESASPSLVPSPLRPRNTSNTIPIPFGMPRSHFSIDTVSTGLISPTDSEPHEIGSPIYDSFDEAWDEDYHEADADNENDASLHHRESSSLHSPDTRSGGWRGYSLPEGMDAGSELTLGRKESADVDAVRGLASPMGVGFRTTFGIGLIPQEVAVAEGFGEGENGRGGVGEEVGSTLDQLLQDMGYLGGVILGK